MVVRFFLKGCLGSSSYISKVSSGEKGIFISCRLTCCISCCSQCSSTVSYCQVIWTFQLLFLLIQNSYIFGHLPPLSKNKTYTYLFHIPRVSSEFLITNFSKTYYACRSDPSCQSPPTFKVKKAFQICSGLPDGLWVRLWAFQLGMLTYITPIFCLEVTLASCTLQNGFTSLFMNINKISCNSCVHSTEINFVVF